MRVLTSTFTENGFQACELWKHKTMNVVYAIKPGSCPPINCEFVCTSTVTV